MKFIIHKSKDKQFYFTIVARNGKTLVTSETYTRKSNAISSMKIFMREIAKAWKHWEYPITDKTKKK